MTRVALLPALFVSLLLACGPQDVAEPTPLEDSPPPGSPPPGCTGDLAVAKTQALFDAFNQPDAVALIAMFPEPGSAAFVVQPELEFTNVPPFPPGNVHQARNPDELRTLLRAAAGYHLEFTDRPQSWAKRIDYFVGGQKIWVWTAGVSTTTWRAVGHGKTFGNGSKVAFNCESGKFLRVVL